MESTTADVRQPERMVATPSYGEISDYRYRLVDYVGDGFLIGSSFGSAFHFLKGLRNSPSGRRLAGGVHAVRKNVPRFAGRSAASLALFWAIESATCLARGGIDDHWNSVPAGAATFGIFSARRGAPAAALFALLGATTFSGFAVAWWGLDLLCSPLLDYHAQEGQLNHASPADPIVGSIENR
ncbi:unnamed protein product [Urochloa decumbens]|uniref:Uncharacterized protein n=1 Tax=Urochloa decumbens TaxID=240449 RepID=A0ABC9BK26_9POAL